MSGLSSLMRVEGDSPLDKNKFELCVGLLVEIGFSREKAEEALEDLNGMIARHVEEKEKSPAYLGRE